MPKKANRSETAAEYLERMSKDPEYVRRKREALAEAMAKEAELQKEEAPVVADLARVGIDVESVYDLVNSRESFPAAMPVLLEHIRKPYHERIREGIARALLDPAIYGQGFDILHQEFLATPTTHEYEELKGCIGLAMAQSANTEDQVRIVLEIIVDPAQGPARAYMLDFVKRLPKAEREEFLDMCQEDPDLERRVKQMRRKRRK